MDTTSDLQSEPRYPVSAEEVERLMILFLPYIRHAQREFATHAPKGTPDVLLTITNFVAFSCLARSYGQFMVSGQDTSAVDWCLEVASQIEIPLGTTSREAEALEVPKALA